MGKQNHDIHCTKIEGLAGAQGLMRHSLLHKQLELLDWQRECLQGLLKTSSSSSIQWVNLCHICEIEPLRIRLHVESIIIFNKRVGIHTNALDTLRLHKRYPPSCSTLSIIKPDINLLASKIDEASWLPSDIDHSHWFPKPDVNTYPNIWRVRQGTVTDWAGWIWRIRLFT